MTQVPAAQAKQNTLLAALWTCGSLLLFSLMAVSARELGKRHEVFEILAYRSLVGLIAVLVAAALFGKLGAIKFTRIPGHALRNGVHFTGQSLWFWAVMQIPLAQVFALEFTSPIWVILLAPLMLGEKLTKVKLFAAALGFAGIWIVAQPDFSHPSPGAFAAAASAIFFALTVIFTKKLTRHEELVSIMFWLTLFQGSFGFILSMRDGAMVLPDGHSAPWLVVIGLCGVGAHFCLTKALSMAPASFVGPIDFLRLPLIALVGAALYGEPLSFALIIGAGLILLANLLTIHAQRRG